MAAKDRGDTKIKKVGRTQSHHNDERATITSDTGLNGPGVNIKTKEKKKHKVKQVNVFERHFRIYFKNGHPAYIVDEEGNLYVFHRVTHSKTSGGRKNWKKENPLIVGGEKTTYIVKKEENLSDFCKKNYCNNCNLLLLLYKRIYNSWKDEIK